MAVVENTIDEKQTRKLLYGAQATELEWIKEVARLRVGDVKAKQPPLSQTQIAAVLGVTRQWIANYIQRAIELKILEIDDKTGKEKIPVASVELGEFQTFNEEHDILKNKLVGDWVQDMQTRKNGKPIKTWKAKLLALERLVNTCKVQPMQIVSGYEAAEKILKNFAEVAKKGDVVYARKKQNGFTAKAAETNVENTIHSVVMAVRDFCGFHHITWRRGVGGIMSGKVIGHGKYADIRLTTEELEKADQFIKQKYGLDSDIYRIFWAGVETCARKTALLTMVLDWTSHNRNGKTTFFMTAYESKTEHIKGGKWTKYISRADLQESLMLAKEHGLKKLWDDEATVVSTFTDRITEQLREIYRAVGKVQDYFYKKSIHALRHIGAHYQLEKHNYNYSLVCILGGWHTEKELKDSYGEMPPEKVIELVFEDSKK